MGQKEKGLVFSRTVRSFLLMVGLFNSGGLLWSFILTVESRFGLVCLLRVENWFGVLPCGYNPPPPPENKILVFFTYGSPIVSKKGEL